MALPALILEACISAPCERPPLVGWRSEDYPPTELYLLRAAGDYRMRLEAYCGPDHCHTRAFLEYLAGENPRKPARAVEIREVAEGIAVNIEDVQPVWGEQVAFDLFLGEERSAVWRITPAEPNGYEFEIVRPDKAE